MIVLRPHIPPFVWIFHTAVLLVMVSLLAAAYWNITGSTRPAALILLSAAIVAAVYLMGIAPLLSSLSFDGQMLVINIQPYGRRKFDIKDIQTVISADLAKDGDFRPVLRTHGTSLGRFRLGHYLLGTRKPAVIMTDRSRVLVIRTVDTDILVGHDLCGELEYALRKALGEK